VVDGAFTAVELSGTIDVAVAYGESASIVVKVDSNLQDKVSVSLQGSTLKISEQSFPSIWASEGAKITVVMPAVSALTLTGTGDLSLSGFVDLPSLSVRLTGTGNCALTGSVADLDLDSIGTGDIEASTLFTCAHADINSTGTGNIALMATGSVNGIMTGTGNLDVWGGATVSVANTGTGRIVLHY
jgi:hypothetical protein